MSLNILLRKRGNAIKERWLEQILDSYPGKSTAFLKKRNRFENPVGTTLAAGVEAIFDGLLDDRKPEDLFHAAADIIKIRAVQEFGPAQAVQFVFQLKDSIQLAVLTEVVAGGLVEEFLALERKIDQLALMVFEAYSADRQRVFEIRMNEIKRTGFRLLRKAELISSDVDSEVDPREIGGCQ
jgi:hypothetical protein